MRALLPLGAASFLVLGSAFVGCAWDVFERPAETTAPGGAGGAGGEGGTVTTGGTGGGLGGGLPVPDGCGQIHMIQETFGDGQRAHIWSESGSIEETTGPFITTDPGSSESLYRSTRRYDLTGGSIRLRVLRVPDVAVSMGESGVFRIEEHDGRYAGFRVKSDALVAGIRQNGAFVAVTPAVPYDAVAHVWLRFMEEDGVLHWQTSPDDDVYTDLATAPVQAVLPDVTRVRVALGSGHGVSGPVGITELDDATGVSPNGINKWCPIHALRDDFGDSFRSRDWLNASGTGVSQVREVDGQLVMSLAPVEASRREYVSSQAYDLTDNVIMVEVAEIPAVPSTTFLELRSPDGVIKIEIIASVDAETMEEKVEILAAVDPSGEDEILLNEGTAYDAGAHRFIRIRESSGAVSFEASADGSEGSWNELATRSPNDISIEDVLVAIGVHTPGAAPDEPGRAVFDNLNVRP